MSLLRAAFKSAIRPRAVAFHAPQKSNVMRLRAPMMQRVWYSESPGLTKDAIESRVLDVLKSFEKVDPAKLSTSSTFAEDLGLDSLDAVEVVMAVEEEFAIEIPDAEADEIKTVQQAIDYIAKTPEAH